MLGGTEGFPRGHRTHSPLTPVTSYRDAGPPSSLQTTAECPVLVAGIFLFFLFSLFSPSLFVRPRGLNHARQSPGACSPTGCRYFVFLRACRGHRRIVLALFVCVYVCL